MYDYLFVTHLPSFYKVNLYNELAKKLRIYVIFVASTSAIRTKDFVSKDMDFDHEILFNGHFEERPRLQTIATLLQSVSRLNFRKVVVGGWDLSEFWAVVFTHSKSRNAVYVESTIAESSTSGLKLKIKKIFIARIGTAFPSGALHQQLLEALGFSGRSYLTGGVGIFNRQKRTACIREFTASFLYVGRLAPEKNLELLVEVFKSLPRYKLTIVGSGPLENKLKSIAPHNVVFKSHVPNEEIAKVYLKHDIFVLPSLREPWGLVVDEALYYGLPVIVSTGVGCHTELVIEGETGLIFDPHDKSSLKVVIGKLSDPVVFSRMKTAVACIDFDKRYEAQVFAYVQSSNR